MPKSLIKTLKNDIFFKFLTILITTVLLTIMFDNYWIDNFYSHAIPIILELFCIIILFSTFFFIWQLVEYTNTQNLLAFGFLSVTIFQMLHTLFSIGSNTYPLTELSVRYSFAGRLTLCITILLFVKSIVITSLNTKIFLFATLLISALFTFILTLSPDYNLLYNETKPTVLAFISEIILIAIFCYSFFKYKDPGFFSENSKSYDDMRLAMLLCIPSEICYLIFPGSSIPLGSVLKTISYFFFFKAIYTHAVIHPYHKLRDNFMKLQAENSELAKTANTLQKLCDSFPVALCNYDSKGTIEYVNQEFEKLFGIQKKDIIGRDESYLNNILQYDGYITFTTLRWQKIKIYCQRHKTVNGYIQFFLDMKKQQSILNHYVQTETILNSFDQCVLMVNKNKQIVMCNIAAEKILNISKHELVGMKLDELCKKLNIKLNVDLNSPEFDIEKNKNINKKLQLPLFVDNVKKEILIHLNSILDINGEAIGLILVCTDITELENSFEKTLHQEKLAILGQLGAGIVHEVRNFLSTIKGRSQIIELTATSESIKRHAKNISKDVDDINNMMNEFLFLAKPHATDLKKSSIKDIFQSIRSMIASSSLINGVNIDINLSDDNKYILCDESQIKQVILNLCKNAVEVFTDKNNAKIVIDSGYNEETNEIFIRVTDNGPGIPKENLPKIGTPFFTTKKNGTGLGLSTCFKIIKNHNGRINIESEVGKGTSFTVLLPCVN